MQLIPWEDIKFKSTSAENQKVLCPLCSHKRSTPQKQKEPCLSVNPLKGSGKCHHCQAVAIKDPKKTPKKEYNFPRQNWENYTTLSDALVKEFKKRGISQQTLIDCKITQETYYQPARQGTCTNIVFNYFEGELLVNKKFRSPTKQFTQIPKAKKIFYGLNDIQGEKEIYIVEGEMDKLAFWEVGVRNCISVPNGAGDLNDIFENSPELFDVEKVYIAVDMDEPGLKLEDELCRRFGKHRCQRIQFKNKDANDDLIESPLTLEEAIKNPVPYPVDGTYNAVDLWEDMVKFRAEGYQKTIRPKGREWREVNDIFSFLLGQLTVVTGIPSHGKSTVLENYILSVVRDYEYPASFYSPEHLPLATHLGLMSEKVIGKPLLRTESNEGVELISDDEYIQFRDWSADLVKLTYPENGEVVDWDWILNKFKEQIFRFGTKIFVIDAFNKIKRSNSESIGEISDILNKITLFCQVHNVAVFLVAHPTKMNNKLHNDRIPTLYDVKGSSEFYDQTHNGIAIHREFDIIETEEGETLEPHTIFKCLKVKLKHQGKSGEEVKLKFNTNNHRYHVLGEASDNRNFLGDIEPPKQPDKELINYYESQKDQGVEVEPVGAMSPNWGFDEGEDVPF